MHNAYALLERVLAVVCLKGSRRNRVYHIIRRTIFLPTESYDVFE